MLRRADNEPSGDSNLAVRFITAIPYLLSVIAMVWWSCHADQRGELIWPEPWSARSAS